MDWVRLSCMGWSGTGLVRVGFGWIGLDWIGLNWIGLDWVRLGNKKVLSHMRSVCLL